MQFKIIESALHVRVHTTNRTVAVNSVPGMSLIETPTGRQHDSKSMLPDP